MTEEPTYAAIPPTPISMTVPTRRPLLGTISAIILFLFALVEAAWAIFMYGALQAFVSLMADFRDAAGAVPSMLLLAQHAQYVLIGSHVAFAALYLIHGITLLHMRPGIIWQLIVTLVARVVVINGIWLLIQWCIFQTRRIPFDVTATIILTASNLLIYSIVIILLTRPSMRKAYAKEPVIPPASEIR